MTTPWCLSLLWSDTRTAQCQRQGELPSTTEETCWDVPIPSCIIQWHTCCEAGISSPTPGEKPHHPNSTQVQVGPLLEPSPSTQGRDLSNSHNIFPHLQSLIPAKFPYSGYITELGTTLRKGPPAPCSPGQAAPVFTPSPAATGKYQPAQQSLPGQSPGSSSSPGTKGM